MPVTRTPHSKRLLQPPRTPPKVEHEVIVLSSDSDSPPPQKMKRTIKARSKSRAKSRSVATRDVIELTDSGDEAPAPRPKKTSSNRLLEAHAKRLEDENRYLRDELRRLNTAPSSKSSTSSVQELERLRTEKEETVRSKKKLLGTIEEYITCEICTLKMWAPYTLMCGHTFCVDCLQDWFSTTLAQHMTTHPDWAPNPPVLAQYRMLMAQPNLPIRTRHTIEAQIAQMQAAISHPNYTCPSCRAPVEKSPIEAFALKNIVRTVAEAEGETSPKRHGAGTGRRDNPWSGFFPTIG